MARHTAEADADAYEAAPLTETEVAFVDGEDWDPAEDWSDWVSYYDADTAR